MNAIKNIFPGDSLKRIAQVVQETERNTGGEIRVDIRQRRTPAERSLSVEAVARNEFTAMGMTNTRDRTGVLIFLLLEERQFCILADEGIHQKVGQDPWTSIAARMTSAFKNGSFTDGVIDAVRAVGAILKEHVPRRPDDTNELPDTVRVR